jgi:hypothetical protein
MKFNLLIRKLVIEKENTKQNTSQFCASCPLLNYMHQNTLSFFGSLKENVYLIPSQNTFDQLINIFTENSVLLLSLVSSYTFLCMHIQF